MLRVRAPFLCLRVRARVAVSVRPGPSFVFCLLSFVFCLLSFVFCLLSFVFCLLSFVFCLLSFVFCLPAVILPCEEPV